jgi:cystathionine beta-lyase/cystathionine gamma-synthase
MRAPDGSRPATGSSTDAVHGVHRTREPGSPVVTPVYQSATFFTEAVPSGEVRYTRYGTNPNHEALANKLAALEGAAAAIVLGSGNAASALSLLSLVGAGDHIVAARMLYGGTTRLLTREFPRLGIETSFVDTPDGWEPALRPNTRAAFLEMPVNPTLRVPDLRPVARLMRERGIPLLVDATFATPVNFRPIQYGADAVIHSATKYLGGHSDVTAGVVAGSAAFVAEVRQKLISFGAVLDPHATWLLERGIKTLALRVSKQNENGLAIARWLCAHPAVQRVHYPGLESHPDHDLARALFAGYGGMVSVVVRGGDEAALRVVKRLRLMIAAPSLGSVETLVSMPRFTSHASLSREERHRLGIEDGFIRLSLGIEEVADLTADLNQALAPEVE